MEKFLFLVFILSVFCSCNLANKENKPLNKTDKYKSVNLSKLEGYWMMSEYIDEILKSKSISQSVEKRMTRLGILLHIENDSLSFLGTIRVQKSNKVKLSPSSDSLTTLKWMGSYLISYDSLNDRINGREVEAWTDEVDSLVYNFRRIKESEMNIVRNIDKRYSHKGLQQNMESLFLDSIIVGEYLPIGTTKNQSKMILNKSGFLNGFKNYNVYSVHNYFGTLHMYGSDDAIIFKDTSEIQQFPSKDHGVYTWEFNQDTLTLTKMTTVSYESYDKGTEQYKFKKYQ